MMNKGALPPLTATNPGPRPGDYPVGSALSRAAARRMLAELMQNRHELIIPTLPGDEVIASAWTEDYEQKSLSRVITAPEGITVAETLRTLGGCREDELEELAKRFPETLICGEIYSLRR